MESEKVKEIKENLEEEISFSKEYDLEFRRMSSDTLQDILTLINELESENERLTKQYVDWKDLYYENTKRVKKLKDRIAELEKENKDYYDRFNNLQTYIDNHEGIWKGNAKMQLKQFAERLKEKFYYEGRICRDIIDSQLFNEVLKEFIVKE